MNEAQTKHDLIEKPALKKASWGVCGRQKNCVI